MNNLKLTWREKYIFLHVLFGLLIYFVPGITKYFILGFTFYGIVTIVRSRNKGYASAHFYASYIVGFEILLRMTRSAPIWEYGKLAVVILLFVGILVETRYKMPNPPIIAYIFLLLPSLLLTPNAEFEGIGYGSWFELFTFNLSGPITLAISVYYFYLRKFSIQEFYEVTFWVFLPIITIATYITFKASSYQEVTYSLAANFQESGGYGANQVSTILGLGVLLVGFSYIFNYQFTFNKYFDLAIALFLMYRCLLTFSRGGLLTPVFSLIAMIIIGNLMLPGRFISIRAVFGILIIIITGNFVFESVNNKTNGAIEKRYRGETAETESKGRYEFTSGRDKLFIADVEIFLEYPIMGTGPGLAQALRSQKGALNVVSHTEPSRMLSEHGVLGLIALLILVFMPIVEYIKSKKVENKLLILGCIIFALFSMSHSGMRTACPGFIYGLAFIDLLPNRKAIRETIEK